MKPRWIAWGAAAAVAAGLVAWVSLGGRSAALPGSGESQGGDANGPEIVLRDVDMREAHAGGGPYRIVADEVTYSLAGKKVVASRVVVSAPAKNGEVVLRAPRASWNTEAGRIRLEEGCRASDGEGITASVETGTLDLRERVFTGGGRATVAGRGFAVTGDNLVWNWPEGRVRLAYPNGRIDPAGLPRRKG